MRITGDDIEGKAQLDNFIDPESRYPVIATTSKLMTTGVDAQTCKLIVLDQRIQSMTEFKQIIGRGTRIHEDYGKLLLHHPRLQEGHRAVRRPRFDGDPVQIYEPGADELDRPPEPDDTDGAGHRRGRNLTPRAGAVTGGHEPLGHRRPNRGPANQVRRRRRDRARRHRSGSSTTAQTASSSPSRSRDYTRRKVTAGVRIARRLPEALERGRPQASHPPGARRARRARSRRWPTRSARDFDAFDLVCHVAFDQPPLTRRERADNVRKRDYFAKYGDDARAVLDALLDQVRR